jgi:hypothetical protein
VPAMTSRPPELGCESEPEKPAGGQSEAKAAGKAFKWLRQVAKDHVNLPKIALTYAIWLTPYLDERGIAHLDQLREGENLGVTDRHLRTGRKALLDRGHLVEAGHNRAGNVFDRIVMRRDHSGRVEDERLEHVVPPERCAPPEHAVPLRPEHSVPTDSLEDSLDLARAGMRPRRIPSNWKPDEAGQRLAAELFGEAAAFEIEKFRDYWAAKAKGAKRADWQAEWRYWSRRQHEMRTGQQSMKFAFAGDRPAKSKTQGGTDGSSTQRAAEQAADELVERAQAFAGGM